MDGNVVLTIIAFISAVAAICGTIYGIYSNKKKNTNMDTTEAEANGRNIGTILTELGYIKSSVDDIKNHQKETDKQYLDLFKTITDLESFKKTTETRLDKIEENIDELKK